MIIPAIDTGWVACADWRLTWRFRGLEHVTKPTSPHMIICRNSNGYERLSRMHERVEIQAAHLLLCTVHKPGTIPWYA